MKSTESVIWIVLFIDVTINLYDLCMTQMKKHLPVDAVSAWLWSDPGEARTLDPLIIS